jgi:hypothetical protein
LAFKNNNTSAFWGDREEHFLLIIFEAALNKRSEGADVEGIDSTLSASSHTCGYLAEFNYGPYLSGRETAPWKQKL